MNPFSIFFVSILQVSRGFDESKSIRCQLEGVTQMDEVVVLVFPKGFVVADVISHRPISTGRSWAQTAPDPSTKAK